MEIYLKKGSRITKGNQKLVNRRETGNAMAKRKRTSNDL